MICLSPSGSGSDFHHRVLVQTLDLRNHQEIRITSPIMWVSNYTCAAADNRAFTGQGQAPQPNPTPVPCQTPLPVFPQASHLRQYQFPGQTKRLCQHLRQGRFPSTSAMSDTTGGTPAPGPKEHTSSSSTCAEKQGLGPRQVHRFRVEEIGVSVHISSRVTLSKH